MLRLGITAAVLVMLWSQSLADVEKDLQDTCSFHYYPEYWHTAFSKCKGEGKRLLCYKSREEIDDITEAFRLSAFDTANLILWISNKNCTMGDKVERCLSLHIAKSVIGMFHFFQMDCEAKYPYVCCINGTKQISVSPTAASSSATMSSPAQNITSGIPTRTTTSTTTESTSTTKIASTPGIPHCKGVKRRGLSWPDTPAGEESGQPCPGKSTGTARWLCENATDVRWDRRGPDMRNCRSEKIKNLKDSFNSTSATKIISEMEKIFQEEIFGSDLADLVSLMSFLPDRLYSEIDSTPSADKLKFSRGNTERTLSMVNRLIELDGSWEDIGKIGKKETGTDLLSTVEGMGAFLASAMYNETKDVYINQTSLVLQVMKPKVGEAVKWVVRNNYEQRGRIVLEDGYDRNLRGNKENLAVVFVLYTDLTRILSPAEGVEHVGELNSPVMSASISLGKKPASISSEVRILVEHLILNPNNTACVFWNMKRHDWDTAGCRLDDSNSSHSLCICNHLTNFALLMDYNDVMSDVDAAPFHYITVVGCSLSIVCLFLCVIIFSCYSYHSRHSWGLRYVIHRNLCICLLIANLVLVIGLDRTDNQKACAVVAGLLHYFFLAAFSWMFLEGVHIYLLLVVIFASRRSHSEKYYAFGYGFPLLVVSVTAISRPTYYGTDEVCWLSSKKGTIWGFMGPVALILMLNMAALLLAQWKASKIKVKDDKTALFKRWLRVTFILFPILGITWIFGFLYIGKHFEIAGYLFAVFNSFQGVCIFVFHCLLDKKARSMVVDSFKKKTTSIDTGSSGTHKKAKEQLQNENKKSSITPIDSDSNKVSSIQVGFKEGRSDTSKKDWSKWRRPWSFCFEMPVSAKSKTEKERENPPKAVAVQWNNLDKGGL